jgi:hypothetical protein
MVSHHGTRVYLLGGWMGKFSVVPRIWARGSGDAAMREMTIGIEDFMGHGDVTFLLYK